MSFNNFVLTFFFFRIADADATKPDDWLVLFLLLFDYIVSMKTLSSCLFCLVLFTLFTADEENHMNLSRDRAFYMYMHSNTYVYIILFAYNFLLDV